MNKLKHFLRQVLLSSHFSHNLPVDQSPTFPITRAHQGPGLSNRVTLQIGTHLVDTYEIPRPPLEGSSPHQYPSESFIPQVEISKPPWSHPIHIDQKQIDFEDKVESILNSPPSPPPKGGPRQDQWDVHDWYSLADPGSGGGGKNPPKGFGGAEPNPDPSFELAQILFYAVGGVACYLGYLWFKGKVREGLAKLLAECQQAQPQELANPTASRQRLVAARPKALFLQKIILFIGGACFAPSILISAFRLFIPTWLAQAIRVLVPSRLFRTLLGSLFSLGVQVISPIVQTLSFGALLYLMNGVIGWAGHSFVPLAQPILGLMEGFFLCPRGGNMVMICMEKQVKIFACTFWWGAFSVRLSTVYRKNKLLFITLAIFAVGAFTLILKDQTFCQRAASQIMALPLGRLFETQLGQLGGLLFGGVFLKSASFSVSTFGLYLGFIYCSKIHKDIGGLPLLPRDG